MKKNRIISSLLCFSLAAGLLIPGLPAYAEGEGESSSGMEISKTAEANEDGTYTITLEAFATGSTIISETTKDVPTDIILVLDQSGSMKESMYTYAFRAYTNKSNSNYYAFRHNGAKNPNLYYKLDDGSYATVSVTRTQGENTNNYTQCPSDWQNYKSGSYSDWDPDCYWKYSNNLYVKNEAGVYQKVTVTYENKGSWYEPKYVYTYTFPNRNVVTSDGNDGQPGLDNFNGNGPVYYLSSTTAGEYTYTYTYTDADDVTHTIGSSTGQNTVPTGFTLYERYSTGSVTRLAALTTAVTTFTNNVAAKAAGEDGALGTKDDVNHRVAVVGYASRADSNSPWINTELFIGATQHNYDVDASNYYNQAFQNMNTQQGQNNVAASIGALSADGATYTNYGLEMANGILNAYPLQSGEKRNRVIVLFTDGYPGRNADDFNQTAADAALTQATTAKSAGVSVYSVGIFSGADASSAGDKNGTNTQAANWFMQQVSSNNGSPRTPSYYLSAADAGTLNSIFQQISDQIESGGSSTTLDENAVIKDIISPAFTLPAGATANDIALETYACTGKNGDAYTWTKNANAMNATAAVNGDQVNVTGFDFAENYVGTVTENGKVTYRGHKLVISFNVSPKAGFLGGNNVYTNSEAGVYENASAQTPVLSFDRPQVNVPIKEVTVTAADKNVYLLSDVTLDELKNGATVKVGDVSLDLSADNYGLEKWQTEYVDITVEIEDKDGNPVSADLENLTDDTTYTVAVTVAPKTNGTGADGTPATAQSGSDEANINVYKPELTYKDSEVFYGDAVPTDFDTNNRTATKWKHGETEADTTKMGVAPTLAITYTPEASKIADGKINSKEDINVDATVKIGDTNVTGSTSFLHTACDPACSWNETTLDGSPAFLLHVKTASLTIQKSGATGTDEGFIFNVNGPENFRVSVEGNGSVTITGLPLGTYTVTEETGWSWRYGRYSVTDKDSVTLTRDNYEARVTVTNTKTNLSLLDGNAYAQNNSVLAGAVN